MKRKYIALILLIYTFRLSAQELKIGDQISNLNFELVNGTETELADFENKVILIDFWATWCGACIVGMPHLDSLQQQYKDDLKVLALSHETKERIERFSKNRPQNFSLGIDKNEEFASAFPHRIIPHTVLIDKTGKVVAITRPENLTHKVIEKVINGEEIDLPLKSENTEFDMYSDYFQRDTTTTEYFVIQPGNPDVPSFTVLYQKGIFKDRRISMLNTTVPGMYREAFQISSYRQIYDIDESQFDYNDPKNRFMLDIIIAPKDTGEIHQIMQKELENALDYNVYLDSVEMDVVILERADSTIFNLPQAKKQAHFSARGDEFKSEGASLDDFRKYLENHGIVGFPVVNETNIQGFYQFDLKYSPEKKGDFQAQLKAIGLKVYKGKRKIEVLRIGSK